MKKLACALVIAGCLVEGCSHTQPVMLSRERMKEVHTIALLGLVVEEEAGPVGPRGPSRQLPIETARADEIYGALAATISQRLAVKVVPREKIEHDSLCRYLLHMPRWKDEELPSAYASFRLNRLVPHGIGDPLTVEAMGARERAQALARLGADAFAVAYVRVLLHSSGTGAARSFQPTAETLFRVYDVHDLEAIWSDRWPTGQSPSPVGGNALEREVFEAAKASFELLATRYSARAG